MPGTPNCSRGSGRADAGAGSLEPDGLTSPSVTEASAASGLIIESPAAELAVGALRDRYDEFAPAGIPAHLTVLFPFIPCPDLAPEHLAQVGQIAAGIDAFDYSLDRTGWFNEHVVWLGPRDPAPFLAVIESVTAAFPDYLPYQGLHADVIPHLTLGHARPMPDLRQAETEVAASLPIQDRASAITLMTEDSGTPGRWSKRATFDFRQAS